ncbi:MAG: hypothetical protein ABI822_09800 [Bryobacteraceae bacterium]
MTIATAIAAGIVGGMITRYIGPPSAFAQTPAPVTNEIRAQSFALVDDMNQTVGTFKVVDGGMANRDEVRIVLRDSTGKEIWSAGGSQYRKLSVK